MRKANLLALPIAAFLLLAGLLVPQAAFASDDVDDQEDSSEVEQHDSEVDLEDGEVEDSEEDSEEDSDALDINELKTRYGNSGSMEVPPLVVKPRVAEAAGESTGISGNSKQPELGKTIDLQNLRKRQDSPAAEFMEKAQVGLLAMGAGALALGGVATTRAVRARRNKTEDYFYSETD